MIRRTAKAESRIDLTRLIGDCHRLLKAPRALRERLEAAGIVLIPAGLDSPVPLLRDIEHTFEGTENNPRPLYDRIFDRDLIATYLRAMDQFADEFSPPRTGDPENCTQYFWDNPQFSYTDAAAYYCMVRWLRPRRIVEIGTGFSTLIASAALQRNGFGEIVCVDPAPRRFVASLPTVSNIIRTPIQEIMPDAFVDIVAEADMLFTDTSHTVKIGSDCLYIYLVLLPSLTQPLTVHSHDIFLPFGMPLNWASELHLHWTEQYLLYAYLLNNSKARVVFGSSYAAAFLREETSLLMRDRYAIGGGSLWYQLNTTTDSGFQPE